MKTVQVGEFKANFSSYIKEIKNGEKIMVSYGKKKEVLAVLVPIDEYKIKYKRKIGILDGIAKVQFLDGFEMTEEELIGE